MAATPFARISDLARRFLLVTAIVIGAACGVAAVAFHSFVEFARSLLIERGLQQHGVLRIVLIVAIPTAVFALIAFVIERFAPRAVGANLARVRMAYSRDPDLLGPRSVLTTFVATPLSLGAGAPLGPEGPIVVISSGLSMMIARWLKLPRKMVRGMIPVGVAAGIAAIFNTPITGVVFALEEVLGNAERGILGGVLVGAVSAAVVEKALLGGQPLLAAPASSWSDARELAGFAVLGIVAGLVSGTSIALSHRLKNVWSRAIPSMPLRAASAGAAIGLLAIVAPSILGVGYDSVSFWLRGGGTLTSTGIAFAVKTIAFTLAVSAGVLGGTFAPSLFIGAALGAATGHTLHVGDVRAYSLVGMGAFFAGLLRSPIAAVLIAVELTRDYELIVPLMLAVSLSVAVSRKLTPLSVVEQQMIDEGFVEAPEHADPLAQLRVGDAMTRDPIVVRSADTLQEAAARARMRHRFYPAVDDDGRFTGLLAREEIESATRERRLDELVRERVSTPRLIATAGERVTDVIVRMQLTGVDRCPVIDDAQSRQVVGFLSPSDLLRARMAKMKRSAVSAADER